ncbi:Uncharacterised protein [Mycobacteroides abscessus subsp. abscessus]|nr:Uncharacterised protein [Mycobacteroides abscessus subsp. abscessus]SKW63410.1 Uncharacterised protein [Mycobacteroides abscessus subsp. abscessus]
MNKTYGIGRPSNMAKMMHWAATQELLIHTCSAKAAAGCSL